MLAARRLLRIVPLAGLFVAAFAGPAFADDGAQRDPGLDDHYRWLPMWRWGSASDLFSDLGYTDIPAQMITGLAQFMFLIANSLWQIVAFAIRNALELEFLFKTVTADSNELVRTSSGRPVAQDFINDTAASVGEVVGTSGLMVLLVVFGVAAAGYQVVRSGGSGLFRNLAATIIPIALLIGMTNQAMKPGNAAGSPGWIASTANYLLTDVGDMAGKTFGQLGNDQQTITTSCDVYIDVLEVRFRQDAPGGDTNPYQRIPLFITNVWENSYLRQYGNAQFGRDYNAWRAACRRAETVSGISAQNQFNQWRQTCRSERYPNLYGCNENLDDKQLRDIFGPYNSAEDHKIAFSIWSGCEWVPSSSLTGLSGDDRSRIVRGNGSPWVVKQWHGLNRNNGTGGSVGQNRFHDYDDDTCKNFWEDSGGIGVERQYVRDRANYGANSIAGAASTGHHDEAIYTVRSFTGHNQANAGLNGFLSLVVAVVYLMTFGGLAAGAILAQIVLAAVVMLLPVLLLAIAWPSPRSTQIAVRFIKLLIGAAASKVLLVFVLGLITMVTSVIYTILGGAAAGSSIGATLVRCLIPFAALKGMAFVFKQFGMDISGFKGALSAASGMSAASMEGAGFGRASQNPISRGIRRQRYLAERRVTDAPRRWMRRALSDSAPAAAGSSFSGGGGGGGPVGGGAGGGGGPMPAPSGSGGGGGSGPVGGGGGGGSAPDDREVIPAPRGGSGPRGKVGRRGQKVGGALGTALGAGIGLTGGGVIGSALGTAFGPAGWIVGGIAGRAVGKRVGTKMANVGATMRRGVDGLKSLPERARNGRESISRLNRALDNAGVAGKVVKGVGLGVGAVGVVGAGAAAVAAVQAGALGAVAGAAGSAAASGAPHMVAANAAGTVVGSAAGTAAGVAGTAIGASTTAFGPGATAALTTGAVGFGAYKVAKKVAEKGEANAANRPAPLNIPAPSATGPSSPYTPPGGRGRRRRRPVTPPVRTP